MVRKIVLAFFFITVFLFSSNLSFGEVSVGVKEGDWIEYEVSTSGNVPEGHEVTWARMEIVAIQAQELIVNVTTRANNGTFESGFMTLSPADGRVGVWFIIPADLKPGEKFFDATINSNVTIEGSEQRTIAGAMRTVTHATTPERIKSWDQSTGVFVESIDVLPNYTLNALAIKTNMWEPQPQLLGGEPIIIYSTVAASIGIFVLAVVVLLVRKRNKK